MSVFKLQSNFLILKGEKVKDFLQGIITNDIYQLNEGKILYSLLLNNKGKFLYDFFLYQVKNDQILIEYHPSYRDGLLRILSLYNLHKKIEIIEEKYNSYISFEANQYGLSYIFPNPINKELGLKIVTKEDLQKNKEENQEENQEIFKQYELKRILNRIPNCNIDLISGSSFPLEYNLYSAFSFNKGCYVGQEVILRFRLPENLKRDIFTIYSDDQFPTPHTELKYANEKIGQILSNCDNYGLAHLEKNKIPSEKQINCNNFSFIILSSK